MGIINWLSNPVHTVPKVGFRVFSISCLVAGWSGVPSLAEPPHASVVSSVSPNTPLPLEPTSAQSNGMNSSVNVQVLHSFSFPSHLTVPSFAQSLETTPQHGEKSGVFSGFSDISVTTLPLKLAQSKIDVPAQVVEQSPVLQRWQQKTPNVLEEIDWDPAFRPRVRFGYTYFPNAHDLDGWSLGIEDVFIARTPLTVSTDYNETFDGRQTGGGVDLRYYFLPLGWYGNVAPTIGYRSISTPTYSTEGLNLGLRFMLAPSRGGAADLSISQNWVGVATDNEVGVFTFSVGYALTRQVRLSADLQEQTSKLGQDTRLGIMLEWLPSLD